VRLEFSAVFHGFAQSFQYVSMRNKKKNLFCNSHPPSPAPVHSPYPSHLAGITSTGTLCLGITGSVGSSERNQKIVRPLRRARKTFLTWIRESKIGLDEQRACNQHIIVSLQQCPNESWIATMKRGKAYALCAGGPYWRSLVAIFTQSCCFTCRNYTSEIHIGKSSAHVRDLCET
jgi:hypothetical protein